MCCAVIIVSKERGCVTEGSAFFFEPSPRAREQSMLCPAKFICEKLWWQWDKAWRYWLAMDSQAGKVDVGWMRMCLCSSFCRVQLNLHQNLSGATKTKDKTICRWRRWWQNSWFCLRWLRSDRSIAINSKRPSAPFGNSCLQRHVCCSSLG